MAHLYEVGKKVVVLKNKLQPWTVGKTGVIEEQLSNPAPPIYHGRGPYYYVEVTHSESRASWCVLKESELAPES